jgi:hypothetical protein
MSSCNLDHSLEDVIKKLEDQRPYLLPNLSEKCAQFLKTDVSQGELNELFHLLKKYDLASNKEKEMRNQKIDAFLTK